MRDPDRIEQILTLLEKAWKREPDQRLCQLLSNLLYPKNDLYYVEDDELEERLKSRLNVWFGEEK